MNLKIKKMKELLKLQKERDLLRSLLQAKSRLGDFGKDFEKCSELLLLKDKEFFKKAELEGAQLSKFGRL